LRPLPPFPWQKGVIGPFSDLCLQIVSKYFVFFFSSYPSRKQRVRTFFRRTGAVAGGLFQRINARILPLFFFFLPTSIFSAMASVVPYLESFSLLGIFFPLFLSVRWISKSAFSPYFLLFHRFRGWATNLFFPLPWTSHRIFSSSRLLFLKICGTTPLSFLSPERVLLLIGFCRVA